MQKWTNHDAGKIQCKRFNEAWGKLNWEANTRVELTGIVGGHESRNVIATMCGTGGGRPDVAEAQERIGARFAWTVTAENVNDIIKAIEAEMTTLEANRPVDDKRRTAEAEAERNAEYVRMQEEQKRKAEESRRAFVAHYGNGEQVTIQPGQMAVTARVCFDNSDSMSDYYDRHASLSQPFALLIVPKGAETERLARRGAAVSPMLAGLEFDWHTEKYSMGHGNYLEAKGGFELPADLRGVRESYRNGAVTRAHWEITFTHAFREPVTLDAIAGYGQPAPSDPGPGTVSGVTVTENDEKDGIEIRFPSRPADEVLETLKANGWRWSRFSGCWYTRRTDRARQFAASLAGKTKAAGGGELSSAPPLSAPAVVSLAARLRKQADALQPKIDHAGRPMTQNPTPKRNRDYQGRMWECRNMERTQRALRVLADLHDAGTVPALLASLKTRDQISKLVHKGIDGGKGGYYSVVECLDYADKTEAGRLLQNLIEGNPEQRAERERARKIEALAAEIALANIPGYFPTQKPVAELMIDRARIENGMSIYEPSAGSGHIADAVRERFPLNPVTCVEQNMRLAELLKLKGYEVTQADFTEIPINGHRYDRILMNPPFEKQQDIAHVQRAYEWLAPDGVLVSVMAPGFEFRSDRKSADFRAWLERVGAEWEDLPEGSFKQSGTGVNTKMVVIAR